MTPATVSSHLTDDSDEVVDGELDDRYSPGSWQGNERDATHERWWRDDTSDTWQGLRRRRQRTTG